MNLIEKEDGSVVGVASTSEFFGLEEALDDPSMEVEPLCVSRERYERRGVPLVRRVECFEVRGEIFKRVVAHMQNYILPEDSSRTNCESWLGGAGSYEAFVLKG